MINYGLGERSENKDKFRFLRLPPPGRCRNIVRAQSPTRKLDLKGPAGCELHIRYIANNSKFRSYHLDKHNKEGDNIGY